MGKFLLLLKRDFFNCINRRLFLLLGFMVLFGHQTGWAVLITAAVYVVLMLLSFKYGLKVPML